MNASMRALIEQEFDKFFDFPTEDRSQVSSVSCKLFAEHIASMFCNEHRDSGNTPT